MTPDSIGPLVDARQYTDFSTEIDLTANPARYIRVDDAGTGTKLVAVEMGSSGGVTRTFTTTTGWELIGQITKIETTTTVSRLLVGW